MKLKIEAYHYLQCLPGIKRPPHFRISLMGIWATAYTPPQSSDHKICYDFTQQEANISQHSVIVLSLVLSSSPSSNTSTLPKSKLKSWIRERIDFQSSFVRGFPLSLHRCAAGRNCEMRDQPQRKEQHHGATYNFVETSLNRFRTPKMSCSMFVGKGSLSEIAFRRCENETTTFFPPLLSSPLFCSSSFITVDATLSTKG
jgi:hypothetical protein